MNGNDSDPPPADRLLSLLTFSCEGEVSLAKATSQIAKNNGLRKEVKCTTSEVGPKPQNGRFPVALLPLPHYPYQGHESDQ
jgi:hypothetical protein